MSYIGANAQGIIAKIDGGTVENITELSVSANSTTNLVTITQTGSGNALVVEDSANPDSTPFVVDSSGRLIIGDSVSRTYNDSIQPSIQTNSTTATYIGAARWSSASPTAAAGITLGRSRGASVGTNGVLNSNDTISNIFFAGDDGTTFLKAASIVGAVDGTPGTNDMPGRLVFSTTSDGASSPTERMRIDSSGDIYSTYWSIKIWTLGGVSSTSATAYRGGFKRIGKMVFIHGYVQGVSNATTFTITNLPYAPKNDAQNVSYQSIAVSYGVDNSAVSTSPVAAYVNGSISSTTLYFSRGYSSSGWTASGNKAVIFAGWYEAETI